MTPKSSDRLNTAASNLAAIVRRVLHPSRFFAARGHAIRIESICGASERWEIFNSQLLGASQTREEAVFDSWRLLLDSRGQQAAHPLIEIKFELAKQHLYITRSLLVYGWETYEPRPNVIESRAAQVWTRELVGTLDLNQAASAEQVAAELSNSIRMALAGTSRLAITSLENPLPQFALGQLAYLPNRNTQASTPVDDPLQLVAEHQPHVTALALETALRTIDSTDIPQLAEVLAHRLAAAHDPREAHDTLFRTLFNQVALSPYTRLVDNLADLLLQMESQAAIGAAAVIDTISYMLRHLARHVTAFDLKQFHNQGANYPDALFADRLLQAYLHLIARHRESFLGPDNRLRRRALRAAYGLRRSLEGVCFPDAPTSPGENQRVLPAEFVRVPDEQIADPRSRSKKLFDVGSTDQLVSATAQDMLAESFADFAHAAELRELGMAVFLDRPLGVFHPHGHIDRTPLVSYEAFSNKIAAMRLDDLCKAQPTLNQQTLLERLNALDCRGVPLAQLDTEPRPGVVSLADAARVADDFIFRRTTRSSLNALLATLHFAETEHTASEADTYHWLTNSPHVLLIRTRGHFLAAYDCDMRLRCTLQPHEPIEYTTKLGLEHLRHGLQLLPPDP